jgi:sugar/nucleoside kinase (ribokinase family)
MDVLSHETDEFVSRMDLNRGAMTLIDEARADELYAAMGPGVEISGGSAANTMVGLASLGARAAYLGKVRSDQLGVVFAHDIRSTGVTFESPAAIDGPATGRCLIMVTPDAQRTMNTYLGASAFLGPEDVDVDSVAAKVVPRGLPLDRPEREAAYVAAHRARGGQRGVAHLSDSSASSATGPSGAGLVEDEVDVLRERSGDLRCTSAFDAAMEAVRRDCRGPR